MGCTAAQSDYRTTKGARPLLTIGLTGGIASGKSVVAKMLQERGLPLIDADVLAREVVAPGQPALQEIVEQFGEHMMLPDGTLNRRALGELVFSDPEARKRLEAITHPRIAELRLQKRKEIEQSLLHSLHKPIAIVCDIPLLFEAGLQNEVDRVWVVWVPREVQIERLMKREGLSREAAEQRLKAQWPLDEKKKLADVVIDNSGTLEETERQVDAALHDLAHRACK